MFVFLKSRVKRLVASDHGSVSIEMVLMVPLLVFVITATIVYFDGFRSKYTLQKSTATIADTLSRELTSIDPDYIDGIATLFDVLTPALANRGMRLTVVSYDKPNDTHEVVWSRARGSILESVENDDLVFFKDRFPLMADLERYIIVETTGGFSSELDNIFGSVLGNITFDDFVAISPRFVRTLCYSDATLTEPAC